MSPELPPDRKPRLPISHFAAILNTPGKDSQPLFIVGGHSVNAWAHHFIGRRPGLAQYKPFTSKDLDCVGDLDDVWHLHQATGWEYLPGKPDVKEFIAGALRHRPENGPLLLVEVLKRTQGADIEELRQRAVEIEFTDKDTHCVRVPDPVLLLKMKMENAISFEQDKAGSERQDIKHVRMMTICCSAFLEEIVEMPDLSIRDRIDAINYSLENLIDLDKEHHYTAQFKRKKGWEVKDCIPPNVLEMAKSEEPLYRQLRNNLTALGFDLTES